MKFVKDSRCLFFVVLFIISIFIGTSCKKRQKPYVLTDYKVTIKPGEIIPNSINVIQGNEVFWVNEDTVAHEIKSGTKSNPVNLFEIGPIQPGQSVSFKFDSIGSFLYYSNDDFDNVMGIVNVKADTLIVKERL